MFFLCCAMQVGLAGWTFTGPPIVGKWAAGLFTMIDQFKAGSGASTWHSMPLSLECIAFMKCGDSTVQRDAHAALMLI